MKGIGLVPELSAPDPKSGIDKRIKVNNKVDIHWRVNKRKNQIINDKKNHETFIHKRYCVTLPTYQWTRSVI